MATRIEVHDYAITAYILPGGEVADAVDDIARNGARLARAYLTSGGHVRTGRLLRGVQWARSKPTGKFECASQITSSASHTRFVHEGTTGPIKPKVKKRLNLPPGYGYPQILARSVKGQSAKPFLKVGIDGAMAAFRAGA